MSAETTRRVGRTEGHTPRGRARLAQSSHKHDGAERFFASSHGVSPAPMLAAAFDDTVEADLVFQRHSVVACAGARSVLRP